MSSPRPIHLLSEAVISGIAAGEVAERPAAIVKELVENSLDAGATRVTVEYDDDDHPRIVVTDDGHGIERTQLELAVTPHATSKLRTLDDLERVTSFGFRGEALASIGAVSRLELVTRPSGLDEGACIRVLGGKIVDVGSAGARPGTRITVSELFANVPARRKFLKSASAEYAMAADGLRRFALAHPGLHLSLLRNGKTAFDFPPVAGLSERLRQVYGREVGASMVELSTRHRGVSLRGAISSAGVSYGSARRVSMFVNERPVHDKLLFRAVMEAYRTYLLKGRYPAAALFLTLDPSAVDVNVHPAKIEVRFADAELVQRFLIESIRETLRGAASPLGRWGLTERDLLRAARGPGTAGPIGPRVPKPAEPTAARERGERADARGEARSAARAAAAGSTPSADPASGLPGYAATKIAPASDEASVSEELPLPMRDAQAGHDLDVVGQIFAGYIVCQAGDELVLVDQHAAHERLLFERLMATYKRGTVESQALLMAATVRVGGAGVDAVVRHEQALSRLGWQVEPFGDEDVVVRALPAIAAGTDVAAVTEKLVDDLLAADVDTAGDRLAEAVLATVACHAAVRVGKRLDRRAAELLLREVGSGRFTASCPHGRPVARTMTRAQVERLFGR